MSQSLKNRQRETLRLPQHELPPSNSGRLCTCRRILFKVPIVPSPGISGPHTTSLPTLDDEQTPAARPSSPSHNSTLAVVSRATTPLVALASPVPNDGDDTTIGNLAGARVSACSITQRRSNYVCSLPKHPQCVSKKSPFSNTCYYRFVSAHYLIILGC